MMQCEKEKSIEKTKYQNPYQRNVQGCIKKPLNEAFSDYQETISCMSGI